MHGVWLLSYRGIILTGVRTIHIDRVPGNGIPSKGASMRRIALGVLLLVLMVGACGAEPATEQPAETLPSPTILQPADTPSESASVEPQAASPLPTPIPPTAPHANSPLPSPLAPTEPPPAAFSGLPLPNDRDGLFTGSGICAACHSSMMDEAGRDVSIDSAWRGSMMANAARDPYWQASVRAEVLANPDLQSVIEEKCATCHMPMARTSMAASGGEIAVLDSGFADPEHPAHTLAMDGVSCTLCHQIRSEGLGEEDSHSGGFEVSHDLPADEREAFGPYPVGPGAAGIMQSASGFVPIQSQHVQSAELCATCHTLYTPYVDADGQVQGEFPEQTPYDEWLASSYGGTVACQDCHMPQAEGKVRISIVGGPDGRSPFYQHLAVGGNTYVLRILESFGEDMEVTASSQQFAAQAAVVRDQLQQRTASIGLHNVQLSGSTLTAEVAVSTLVGHKFPTSFPSRRAWIHLVVQDANGEIVFESGTWQPDGSIVGNDNDMDPSAYEPHYNAINDPDQVQIYEAILANTDSQVTTTLLRAAAYLKDNRLLPAGLDKGALGPDIAVAGRALEDDDFAGGSDHVSYMAEVGEAQGPFTVRVELLYQAIGYRWAMNLRAYAGDEPARFSDYYASVRNSPELVAQDTVEVGD